MLTKTGFDAHQGYLRHLVDVVTASSVVYVVVHGVSRSGMQRLMSFYVIDGDRLACINGLIVEACGYRRGKHEGLIVRGCGMDMGFAVVNDLCNELAMPVVPHEFI